MLVADLTKNPKFHSIITSVATECPIVITCVTFLSWRPFTKVWTPCQFLAHMRCLAVVITNEKHNSLTANEKTHNRCTSKQPLHYIYLPSETCWTVDALRMNTTNSASELKRRNSNRHRNGTFLSSFFSSIVLALLFLISKTASQDIGTEICACAPGSYEFTLDFSLFCPPVNITVGDAVAATSCAVNPFDDPSVSDLIPVAVNSIDIFELNQDLEIYVEENIVGSFGDGDTFQYTSIAALPGEIVDPRDLPRAIQINLIGVNRFDQSIINIYLITFSNNCGRYPVLFEGQFAGWTRFVSTGILAMR